MKKNHGKKHKKTKQNNKIKDMVKMKSQYCKTGSRGKSAQDPHESNILIGGWGPGGGGPKGLMHPEVTQN